MKIYFYLGVGIIITMIVGLLGYGVYLNQRGENEITQRMENHKLPLSGQVVGERDIQAMVELDLVNLYAEQMTDVIALENGRVAQAFVEKNSHVTAGMPIVQLMDEDISLKLKQADSDILEAEAQLVKARNSYNRYSQLVDSHAISLEKYDEAAAAYKAAQARLANYETQKEQLEVRQSRQVVTSPIEGEVLTLYLTQGAYVTAGTAVALVGDFSQLRFVVPAKDEYARYVQEGDELELTVTGGKSMEKSYGARFASGNLGDGQVFKARLIKITPDLNEPAAMRQLTWEVDNRVGLLEPGAYSKVCLRSLVAHHCLVVPFAAFTDENRDQVSVVDENGCLATRMVKTGINDGEYMEILSGLQAGDVVITADTDGIAEGTPVEIVLEDN